MTLKELTKAFPTLQTGAAMHALAAELYPICRSITGNGFRASQAILQKHIPVTLHEVPSGTQVFDWTVPREWNIRDAWVRNPQGEKIVDFGKSNLHILQYSVPTKGKFALRELRQHLFSLPDHPDWIPYRTSYYKENWGFCVTHRLLESLRDGEYEVCIDSSLDSGSLTYGEYVLRGATTDEILISCHSCHPSLCNDNLSGMAVATTLARLLNDVERRYTYRFLFIPGAIGSITWLSSHREETARVRHGLVVACVGDGGSMTYKKSRRGNAEIDRAVLHVLHHKGKPFGVKEFSPYGYDERQYCSPGFNLSVGSLTRTPHGEFPQYHTSEDNLEFIRPEFLEDSLATYLAVMRVLEGNRTFINLNPHCEPQLGKRGLYRPMGGQTDEPLNELAMLWVLNLSDGEHALLDIAERSGMAFDHIAAAAEALHSHGLLRPTTP
jgi:aminopeptidase-like protein